MDGHARIAGIVAAALVLGLSCVFAVGCGGAKNMSSSHAASSTGSAGGVSRARALAFAHAVNLRPADVPGTSAIAPEAETAVKPLGLQAARCEGGVSPHRRLVDVKSRAL